VGVPETQSGASLWRVSGPWEGRIRVMRYGWINERSRIDVRIARLCYVGYGPAVEHASFHDGRPVSASSDVTFKYSIPQPAGKAIMSTTYEQLLPASRQMVHKPRSTASLPKPWKVILAMSMDLHGRYSLTRLSFAWNGGMGCTVL
jgi:hypothetical protein